MIMVHRALQVPEILATVFECFKLSIRIPSWSTKRSAARSDVEHRTTLARLARTCRDFFPVAIAILWRDIDLSSLLLLLPLETHPQGQEECLILPEALIPDDIFRFNRYSKVVRQLCVTSNAMPIRRDIFLALFKANATLPFVQELHWAPALGYTGVALLMGPSLKQLIINQEDDHPHRNVESEMAAESLLSTICARCPALETLAWVRKSVEFSSILGISVLGLQHLNSLTIPLHGAHAPLLLNDFAHMQQLKRLMLWVDLTVKIEQRLVIFDRLEELTVEGYYSAGFGVLDVVRCPNLSHMTCVFGDASLEDVCLHMARCAGSGLSVLGIGANQGHADLSASIEPLHKFSQLQSFSLSLDPDFPSTPENLSILLGIFPELHDLHCLYQDGIGDDAVVNLTLTDVISHINQYPKLRSLTALFDASSDAIPLVHTQHTLNRPFHLIVNHASLIDNPAAVARFLHTVSSDGFYVTSGVKYLSKWSQVVELVSALDRARADRTASEIALLREIAQLRQELANCSRDVSK